MNSGIGPNTTNRTPASPEAISMPALVASSKWALNAPSRSSLMRSLTSALLAGMNNAAEHASRKVVR